MKRTAVLAMALLFITSCAGMPVVKGGINYSGKWTGQSYIDAQQGMVDNFDLVLVHEGDVVSGVISDSQGYMSNAQLWNVALDEKTLTFSFTAATPMGNVKVDSTGTFSTDGETLELYFQVPDLNITGSANLKKS